MFNEYGLNKAEGRNNDKDLVLLGLTTCSFCKKAKQFLDDNDFQYNYLFLDKIDPDVKKKLKLEFSQNFDKRLSYPTLIIDDKELLTGFIRPAWELELLGES